MDQLAKLPIGVYETDPAGRFVYVNEQWSELTGVDAATAQYADWASVVHPEDRERVVAEWERSQEETRPFSLEYRYLRPDGSAVWVWCRAVKLTDDRGEVTGYLGTCSDTVVSPTVDRALEEAEKRFANAFEEAPIGMALVGLDGRFLRVNRALPEIVGYDSQTLLGLTFQDITHPDDLDADLELVRQVVAGELRSYRMEKRYVRADGKHRWVLLSVSLVRDESGEPLYFVSQIEDITERRRSEDALREAEDRFRSAFDDAPIGMAIRSVDGRFLRVNPALCEITGYSREELEAMTYRSITHPDDLSRDEKGINEVMAGQTAHYRTEKRYIHADGHVIPVDLSATVVRDADGEPLHVLTQVQDITERKRFEGQLQYLADHDSLTGPVQPAPLRGGAHARAARRRALRHQARGARDRPRRLQVHQRLARPLDRRRADHPRRPGAARSACGAPTCSPGSAATSSPWCCRAPGSRRRSTAAEHLLAAVGEVDLVGLGGRKVAASIGVSMFGPDSRAHRRGAAGRGRHRDVRRQGGRPRPHRPVRPRGGPRGAHAVAHDLGRPDPRGPGQRRLRAARATGPVADAATRPRAASCCCGCSARTAT